MAFLHSHRIDEQPVAGGPTSSRNASGVALDAPRFAALFLLVAMAVGGCASDGVTWDEVTRPRRVLEDEGLRCPAPFEVDEPLVPDPTGAVGCFDVFVTHAGEAHGTLRGALTLTRTRDLWPHERLASMRCGGNARGEFVDVPCPDELATRGVFRATGTDRGQADTWSATIDGRLIVTARGMTSACMRPRGSDFDGLMKSEDGRYAESAELRRRACRGDESLDAPMVAPTIAPKASLELPLAIGRSDEGSAFSACFGKVHYVVAPRAAGCYEFTTASSTKDAPRPPRVLRLGPQPQLVKHDMRDATCLVRSGGGYERVDCPVFAEKDHFRVNGAVLTGDDAWEELLRSSWAETDDDGHIAVTVSTGFVGVRACFQPTATGLAGRVVDWSDAGGDRDGRPVTLTKVECSTTAPTGPSK